MSVRQVFLYTRFERFWHWSQVLLVGALLFSGFAVHGINPLLGFQDAVTLHTAAAIGLMVLWVFAIFWHLTTGNWRHYVPTTNGLWRVARFYAWDIFKGERHPYRKAYWRKHNPLQALSYLGLKLVLFPLIWVTGIAYLLYALWSAVPGATAIFSAVALTHTFVAFAMLAFIILHVYLLSTDDSFIEHVRPMVTGFDKVDLTAEEEAYLESDEPGHIR